MAENDKTKQQIIAPFLMAGVASDHAQEAGLQNFIDYFRNLRRHFEYHTENDFPIERDYEYERFQAHWKQLNEFELSPSELVEVLRGSSAALEIIPGQLKKDCLAHMKSHFKNWEKQTLTQLPYFSEDNLLLTLWHYRDLNIDRQSLLLPRFYELIDPNKYLSAPENEHKVVRSMVAHAKLNLIPDERFQERWTAKALEHLPEFSPSQHAYSLWCFARLRMKPPEDFIEAWVDRLETLLDDPKHEYSDRYLANALGACAALIAIFDLKDLQNAAHEISNEINFKQCTYAEQRQVKSARRYLGFVHEGATFLPSEQSSALEDNLRKAFHRSGFQDVSHTVTLPIDGDKVDMAFEITIRRQQTVVVIEVDGPQHFLEHCDTQSKDRKRAGFNGRTLYKSSQILSENPDAVVVRMPYNFAQTLLKKDKSGDFKAPEILEMAAKLTPGAYHAKWQRGAKPVDLRPVRYATNPAYDGLDFGP